MPLMSNTEAATSWPISLVLGLNRTRSSTRPRAKIMTAASNSPSRCVRGTTARVDTSRMDRSPGINSVATTTATANPTKMATPPRLGVGLACQRSGEAIEIRPHLKAAPRTMGVMIKVVTRASAPTRKMLAIGFTSRAILDQRPAPCSHVSSVSNAQSCCE